jgi:hypothetical protein
MNRIVPRQKNMKINGTNVSGTMKKQLKLPERIEPVATEALKNSGTNRG